MPDLFNILLEKNKGENILYQKIVDWYQIHKRGLPWRNTKDPYKVWISEIILQQTRVNQGMNYYLNFIQKFPNLSALLAASEEEVLLNLQGLGYYNRAANIYRAAKQIANDYKGNFPDTYDELLRLKGVGAYTAGAISSICFGEHRSSVDGNVLRVMARIYGIEEDLKISSNTKQVQSFLDVVIQHYPPSDFNQALMELGALVCLPSSPDCMTCPINHHCLAFNSNKQHVIPIKTTKKKKKKRYLYYLFIQHNDKVLMNKRGRDGIWKNMYDLPCVESEKNIDLDEVKSLFRKMFLVGDIEIKKEQSLKHILTHQELHVSFYSLTQFCMDEHDICQKSFSWKSRRELGLIPKPKIIQDFLS